MCAYLYLLIGGNCTEHYLSKRLLLEHSQADPSNHLTLLDQSKRVVFAEGWEGEGGREGGREGGGRNQ